MSRKELNKLLDERNHYKEELLDLKENFSLVETYQDLRYNSKILDHTLSKPQNNSLPFSQCPNEKSFLLEKSLVCDSSLMMNT